MQTSPDEPSSRRHARVAALALAAAIMLVPANVLPVLHTRISGAVRTDTIFSGVMELWEAGLWALALIVFIASFVVPLGKLAGLVWLLRAARCGTRDPRRLTRWHARLDFIGRWSMLDVFLAAFLAGLVQFGALATVEPRPGLLAFAAAVVLTMLATRSFDPRVLWERPTREVAV
jgi:paraquat-inducible protein A